MPSQLLALTSDAHDPARLAAFWAGLLGRQVVDDDAHGALLPGSETQVGLRFVESRAEKAGPPAGATGGPACGGRMCAVFYPKDATDAAQRGLEAVRGAGAAKDQREAPKRRPDDAPEEDRTFVYIEPRAGDVLMWESFVRHEVPANMAKRARVSISFNYGW